MVSFVYKIFQLWLIKGLTMFQIKTSNSLEHGQAVSGKAGSCLPLVGSLQYRTLANYEGFFINNDTTCEGMCSKCKSHRLKKSQNIFI